MQFFSFNLIIFNSIVSSKWFYALYVNKHFRHNFSIYCCAEKDCNRSFHLLNSYKKHLSSHIKRLTIESTSKNYLIGSQLLSISNPICGAYNPIVNVNTLQLSNVEPQ